MGWPRGKPRKKLDEVDGPSIVPEADHRESTEAPERFTKSQKKAWRMVAGNNWDSAVEGEENPDRYHIPKDMFPAGMDLQWCTQTIYGQEMTQRINGFFRTGWTPVHKDDFDGQFAAYPTDNSGFVKVDGMALCARPLELSIKARNRDKRRAEEQIQLKEAAFKGGEIPATGANHPSALATNRISRTMERIEVPKD